MARRPPTSTPTDTLVPLTTLVRCHCRSPVRRARGIWHERRQMSLGNCIPGMVERGEIDEARAKRMAALFDELSREYAKTMSPEAAEIGRAACRERVCQYV